MRHPDTTSLVAIVAIGCCLGLPMRDLAAMIAGARQSVNRVLRSLERDGLVRIDGEQLMISDASRLEARSRL